MSEMPQEKTATGDENLGLVGPDSFLFGTIPHYHGDLVRQLMLGAAALIILAIPMISKLSLLQTPLELIAAITLIVCASVTTPRRIAPFFVDAIVCAIGLVIYEPLAIAAYQGGDLVLFVVYEALALIFVFALYFSVKSIRGMTMRKEMVMQKRDVRIREDGEEYTDSPVALFPPDKEEMRQDSRSGDLRNFGRYDD